MLGITITVMALLSNRLSGVMENMEKQLVIPLYLISLCLPNASFFLPRTVSQYAPIPLH